MSCHRMFRATGRGDLSLLSGEEPAALGVGYRRPVDLSSMSGMGGFLIHSRKLDAAKLQPAAAKRYD